MPAFSVALGVAILAAAWAGGDPAFGVFGLGLMTALGAVFLFGGRSETLSGLGGPGRDERWAAIDLRATAGTGLRTASSARSRESPTWLRSQSFAGAVEL